MSCRSNEGEQDGDDGLLVHIHFFYVASQIIGKYLLFINY